MSPGNDREKVVVETMDEPEFTAEQIGWRFALGTVVIVGSYAAWPLIPVVLAADIAPGMKAALSGLFGATPLLSKFVAVALMGRPAYYFLKRTVFSRLRRSVRPAE
ncbi:MAG: hypothetical protein AB7V40_07840 [Methyloceanibacter sp.]